MAERPRIDLFCEDRGHEQFVRALVERLAREVSLRPTLQAQSTRGGHARALSEFRLWQKGFLKSEQVGVPDVLVLIIDSNCRDWTESRNELEGAIDEAVTLHKVVGCPDPHVERWYMADPVAFHQVVGVQPGRDLQKCERDFYKHQVEEAAEAAKIPLLTGPADLAADLVAGMDLYRAGKNQPSLGHFIDAIRGAFRRLT